MSRKTARPQRTSRTRLALRAGVIVTAAVVALLPLSPAWVERVYSRGAYASLQPILTSISSLLPFAILDALLVLALIWIAWSVIRVVRAPRGRRLAVAGAWFGTAITVAACVYLAFLACWGLNYRRQPLAEQLDFSSARVTPAAVEAFARRAVDEMNGLHAQAHADAAATATMAAVRVRLAPAFSAAQRALGEERLATAGRPKWSVLSPVFRWATVDGMVNPLGLEVLVNPDVLPFERPAVVAHEWGHLAGWARESEASFLGWLTCQSGDASARYSGWVALYWHLRGEIGPQARQRIEARLADGPRRDLAAIMERLRRGQPLIQQASWVTYDQFLKANRVDAGVRSYDEVVTLVVGTAMDEQGRPRRR